MIFAYSGSFVYQRMRFLAHFRRNFKISVWSNRTSPRDEYVDPFQVDLDISPEQSEPIYLIDFDSSTISSADSAIGESNSPTEPSTSVYSPSQNCSNNYSQFHESTSDIRESRFKVTPTSGYSNPEPKNVFSKNSQIQELSVNNAPIHEDFFEIDSIMQQVQMLPTLPSSNPFRVPANLMNLFNHENGPIILPSVNTIPQMNQSNSANSSIREPQMPITSGYSQLPEKKL